MLQVYFECYKNRGQAVHLYRKRFPNQVAPEPCKFARLEENLRNYGAFKKPKRKVRQFLNEDVELNVLLHVAENSQTSTREIAQNIGTSNQTVHAVLKKHKMKPYIPQKVHALDETDRGRRLEFCRFYLGQIQQDPIFYRKIIWSDKCMFGNMGIFNRNIHQIWSQENPRAILESNFQRRFSLNVWCGIVGEQLIGPFFIDGTLNQENSHQLLNENIQFFLEILLLADLNRLYIQQDEPRHITPE